MGGTTEAKKAIEFQDTYGFLSRFSTTHAHLGIQAPPPYAHPLAEAPSPSVCLELRVQLHSPSRHLGQRSPTADQPLFPWRLSTPHPNLLVFPARRKARTKDLRCRDGNTQGDFTSLLETNLWEKRFRGRLSIALCKAVFGVAASDGPGQLEVLALLVNTFLQRLASSQPHRKNGEDHVDTDNAKSKRKFRKLSKCMGDKFDKEKGRIEGLEAPGFKRNPSVKLIRQRAAEKERMREANRHTHSGTINRMQFTFSVDQPAPAPMTTNVRKSASSSNERPRTTVQSRSDDSHTAGSGRTFMNISSSLLARFSIFAC
ncbi:hypothetical protein NMY22_g10223 [Coprinellus aureogranulatus]|nr:hypothetical protein NMY22_g10223 [Coprinellus aureogranulatus]